MRILVAEDEPRIAAAVARGLRREGMAVDVAPDGAAALYKARVNPYDVVVLDRDLPEVHGDDVCRTLSAEQPRTKVLMLTAARTTDELVQGLSLGADDYLTKPFRFAELVARLRALGRRTGDARPPVLQAADVVLDPAARTASRAGLDLDLTLKEFAVLQALLEAQGAVVTPEELLERAWDEQLDPLSQHRPHDRHDAAAQARRPAGHPDGPRERLPRVIPHLRVRLTAIYGGIFVVFVAILLSISYWLMARHLDRTLDVGEAATALGQLRHAVPARAGRGDAGRDRARAGRWRGASWPRCRTPSTRASASWPTRRTSCARPLTVIRTEADVTLSDPDADGRGAARDGPPGDRRGRRDGRAARGPDGARALRA